MKNIFFTFSLLSPGYARAGQECEIEKREERVTREAMKGNEIITRTYLVTQYYVNPVNRGDDGAFRQGPYSTEADARLGQAECQERDDGGFFLRDKGQQAEE